MQQRLEALEDSVERKLFRLRRRVGNKAWMRYERIGRDAFELEVEEARNMEEQRLRRNELANATVRARHWMAERDQLLAMQAAQHREMFAGEVVEGEMWLLPPEDQMEEQVR